MKIEGIAENLRARLKEGFFSNYDVRLIEALLASVKEQDSPVLEADPAMVTSVNAQDVGANRSCKYCDGSHSSTAATETKPVEKNRQINENLYIGTEEKIGYITTGEFKNIFKGKDSFFIALSLAHSFPYGFRVVIKEIYDACD